MREITEQYAGDWEQTYEDALAESELTEEDETYLQSGVKEAGGFSPFVQRNLRRLEEAAPDEEKTGDPAARISPRPYVRYSGRPRSGGVMMGNFFYFGFAVGMSRKAGCW